MTPEAIDEACEGEDEAAVAALRFMLEQTPPPKHMGLDLKRCLKTLTEHLPRVPLTLPPPPEVPLEFDYAPGDPRRDESDEAEARRRAPPPRPPPSEVEKFLEMWYADNPDCPRIDFGKCSIWDDGFEEHKCGGRR